MSFLFYFWQVPMGITAANKQSPLLMLLEYRVKLSDQE